MKPSKQTMIRPGWRRAAGYAGVLVLAVALVGCLGDGDDGQIATAATNLVPASASASVAGFISYLQALIATSADTLSPVDTTNFTPPTVDNAEPSAV